MSAPVAHDESLVPAASRVAVVDDPVAEDVVATAVTHRVDAESDPVAEGVSSAPTQRWRAGRTW